MSRQCGLAGGGPSGVPSVRTPPQGAASPRDSRSGNWRLAHADPSPAYQAFGSPVGLGPEPKPLPYEKSNDDITTKTFRRRSHLPAAPAPGNTQRPAGRGLRAGSDSCVLNARFGVHGVRGLQGAVCLSEREISPSDVRNK